MKSTLPFFLAVLAFLGCSNPEYKRSTVSLNGEWQLAITPGIQDIPVEFEATVSVPGLVDLAIPRPDTVVTSDRIYWHRKTFFTSRDPFILCKLKINKAKYHTRVFINGHFAGGNPYSFTPTEMDITGFLKPSGQSNEIMIAVGCRNTLPDTVADGNDFEKDFYYPGIYDDVNLIFSGTPYISNVQCAPRIEEEKLLVRAEFFRAPGEMKFPVTYRVLELAGGKEVAFGTLSLDREVSDFEIDLPGCRLWTPEDPFLYTLELETPADQYSTRFGMRSFRFDPEKKLALLNGDPYYLRGTNVCIYRFFDDPGRLRQPWDKEWVTRLHEQFKYMHWNSIRYCIGFPPERWYEIADSVGFLIADEFPLWYGNDPHTIDSLDRNITAKQLAGEYRAWMRERWNHPCVVIWDAQNESVTPITGDATEMVRDLDLSNRPWENGWSAPRAATDPIESHPYLYTHFFAHRFDPPQEKLLTYFFDTIRIPHNDCNEHNPAPDGSYYENPVLINEYCWLWMNRNGTPTRLTGPIYDNAFGDNLSMAERFNTYARHLAIMTEYWRAHRTAAGVQHFCGLGYSRPLEPRGETSDNFADIDKLIYEPNFETYVKPAFAPVGLMLDVWDHTLKAGSSIDRNVYLINDLGKPWRGTIRIYFESGGEKDRSVSLEVSARPYECRKTTFSIQTPSTPGPWELVAEIIYNDESVRSIREIKISQQPSR